MSPGTTHMRLIVNADDFGLSDGVNRGIIEAHERGIVTSTSLMVRQLGAAEAASYARSHPVLGLGLHLDLGEWICRNGEWEALYEVVSLDDAEAIRVEIDRQLSAFLDLVGRQPTHVDSHQHVHVNAPARAVVAERATALGLPVRHIGDVRYCGKFYGQSTEGQPDLERITPESLIAILTALPAGTNELACHPGYARDLETMYANEREVEVRTLCDRRVAEEIEALGIELVSFADHLQPSGSMR